jgi:DNA-binding PadR family transcriptional regulator
VLEFTILGLLKERPMYGYELRKRMREEFGALENLSFGSLYPALARLESDGAIRTVDSDGASAPSPVPFTGSLGGERAATVTRRTFAAAALGGRGTRSRKIYEITPSGEALFDRLLDTAEEKGDPRSFSLRLAFAGHLSPAARLRLLERHQLELTRRLARANGALEAPSRPLDQYQRSIAEHARDTVRSDLLWITTLVEREIEAAATASHLRSSLQPPTDPREPAPAGTGRTHDGGNS